MSNGDSQTVAVPTGSFTQGDSTTMQDQSLQDVLKRLLSQQARPTLARTGVPAPIPQQQSTVPPRGMNRTGSDLYSIGTAMQNAVARWKGTQLAEAESDWGDLTTSIQKYIKPDGSIDPRAYSDPAVMNVLGNAKKLKKMAKALNQDWLNPEKTDVYAQALQQHLGKQKQKQQAAQGLRSIFSQLIQRRNQPQFTQQQSQDLARQVMSKAPMAQGSMDPAQQAALEKSQAEMITAFANLEKASSDAKLKYNFQVGADGNLYAEDKISGSAKQVTGVDGAPIKGQQKGGGNVGKPVIVDGKPIGIGGTRNGQFVVKHPGDPDWTGADAATLSAANAAYSSSEAAKDRRIQLSANSRVSAYLASRFYPVQDASGKEIMVSGKDLAANQGAYSPLTGAAKAQGQQAVFQDLKYTMGQLGEAVAGLGDQGFDATARAQFLLAMRSNDPNSAFQQFLSSEAASTLTDAQVNYVTAIAAATEGAMMLRSVGGMGAGSDMLRSAIEKMVPGPGTPTTAYAKRQLELINGQIARLEKAVPSTAFTGGHGDMETETYNGHTYTRKKGSNDPWKLSN